MASMLEDVRSTLGHMVEEDRERSRQCTAGVVCGHVALLFRPRPG
jgi:hypothetical protein